MQNLSNPRKDATAGKIVHTKKNKHDEGKTTRPLLQNYDSAEVREKPEENRDTFRAFHFTRFRCYHCFRFNQFGETKNILLE